MCLNNCSNGTIHYHPFIHFYLSFTDTQLEEIRKEGENQKEALKQHMQEAGPALNYRKAEQVWDNYYKTMFTLKTVSQDLRQAVNEASEILKKVGVR